MQASCWVHRFAITQATCDWCWCAEIGRCVEYATIGEVIEHGGANPVPIVETMEPTASSLAASVGPASEIVDVVEEPKKGIDALVLVLSLQGRFTDEEMQTVNTFKRIFGEECWKSRAILVWTHADALKVRCKLCN
eukprot:161500-Prorocentrum_minimum.AAC.2